MGAVSKQRVSTMESTYLERVADAIAEAKANSKGSGKVALVAHSTGGLMARIFMAEFGTADIDLLITLGTWNRPPPRGIPGVSEQTKGLLTYADDNFPGAYHPQVKYITIAGRSIKGERLFQHTPPLNTSMAATSNITLTDVTTERVNTTHTRPPPPLLNRETSALTSRLQANLAGRKYRQVCGEAAVWGDGVMPEHMTHLEGALNITINNVHHSPAAGSQDKDKPWYGSAHILDQWVDHLLA